MKYVYVKDEEENRQLLAVGVEINAMEKRGNTISINFNSDDIRIRDQWEGELYDKLDIGDVYLAIMLLVDHMEENKITIMTHQMISNVLENMVADINTK